MTNIVNTNLLPTASSNSTSIITPESSIVDAGSENNTRNLQLSTTSNTSTTTSTNTTTTTTTSSSQETCLICGDVASGKHYGLRSCEACKAFFKRTVQGKIEYSCPATKECEINKRRRKACQACRFQKCLNMGMLKEGVRLDRVRGGRQKYRQGNSPTNGTIKHQGSSSASSSSIMAATATAATSITSSTTSSSSSSSSSSMGLNGSGHTHLGCQQQLNQQQRQAQYYTATTPSKQQQNHNQHQSGASTAAQNNNIADQSFENQIMTALINCEPEELVSTQFIANIPSHLNLQMKTLYILSDLFDRELVSLIGWAKQIPGFSEQLTLNDQMRLLQSTWAEVIALSIGYRSYLRRLYGNGCNTTTAATPSPSSLSPASTSSYNSSSNNSSNCLHNSATTTTANSNTNNLFEIRLAFAKDLAIDQKHAINCGAEEIFYNCAQLVKRLEYLKMKHQEYILLKAISLTNADVRLENPSATFRLRDLLMSALNDATQDKTCLSTSSTKTPSPGIKLEQNQLKDASASTVSRLNGDCRPLVNHRLNEILLCLPVLRQIDSSIRKFWNDIRKGPNNVPMNKLFEEMLEPCQKMYRSAAEI